MAKEKEPILGWGNVNGISAEDDRTCALNDMNCLETQDEKTYGITDMNATANDDSTCALVDKIGRAHV